MKYVTYTLAAIALLAILIFAVQNLGAVEVSFLAWTVSISKFVVIIASYALGMVTGWGLLDLFKRAARARS